jgi:hypothetical protein
MRKRIWKLFGIAAMVSVMGFGLIQATTTVVRANGCPVDPNNGCMCTLHEAISVQSGGQTVWYCTYGCYCGYGDGNFFYIERTYEYPEE